jgi:hypothetical protein
LTGHEWERAPESPISPHAPRALSAPESEERDGKMMVMILELRKTRKPVPVDVQCTMDDRVQQNQTQYDISQCTWTNTMLMCYGMHL